MQTFREQHQSLIQFKGTLSLFKSNMADSTKLKKVDEYWEPCIREAMLYWMMVCFDRELIPFEPIPFDEGEGKFKENPLTTPCELIDMLYEELNRDEAKALLEDLDAHMFRPAYEVFRRILSRDLSCFFVTPELAMKIIEHLGG